MGIRRRTTQRLKWTGTFACALLAMVFAASLRFTIGYRSHDGNKMTQVFIQSGNVEYFSCRYNTVVSNRLRVKFPTGWFLQRCTTLQLPDADLRPMWVHHYPGTLGMTSAGLALWFPYALILIPTLILFRLDRRPPPGHCPRCRYNLTGNTTGVCPECGLAIPSPSPVAPAQPADPLQHTHRGPTQPA